MEECHPRLKKIVRAIDVRNNAEVLPSGMTALNVLGLSTQVPMNYAYLTTGCERTIKLTNRHVVLKRGVPKNFCYETRLVTLLVQALRTLKQENVGHEELQAIRTLMAQEPDKDSLAKDVDKMPVWMRQIINQCLKPMKPMNKLWLNYEPVDRVAMLQKTEAEHLGIIQVDNL